MAVGELTIAPRDAIAPIVIASVSVAPGHGGKSSMVMVSVSSCVSESVSVALEIVGVGRVGLSRDSERECVCLPRMLDGDGSVSDCVSDGLELEMVSEEDSVKDCDEENEGEDDSVSVEDSVKECEEEYDSLEV